MKAEPHVPALDGSLRWRIPVGSDPQHLRVGFVQLLMAAVVSTLIVMVAMPRESLAWSLGALVPLIAIVGYWKWRRYQQSLCGPENVWLDDAGLHWHAGDRQLVLQRADVVAFRIGLEPDTVRQVPALTIMLSNEFESQPFELHEPANAATVGQFLRERWQIADQTRAPASEAHLAYDQAIDLYSECHAENQEWHFEGAAAAFAELAALLEQTAAQFPLPPPGAKPRGRIVLARRGHPSHLRLEHAHHLRIDHDLLSGPAAFLTQLAADLRAHLPDAAGQDSRFEVSISPRNKWTLHLHLRA